MSDTPASPGRLEVETVPCPLCGTASDAHAEPWAERSVEGQPVRLVRCARCTLVHANPRISAASAAELFDSSRYFAGGDANLGYSDYVAGERYLVATARDRLRRIGARVPGGRLLEIGSAAGFFLSEAARLGFEPVGVERSPAMCAHAREALGATLLCGDLADMPLGERHLEPGSYAAVAAFGVTSLLRDPGATFERIAALLRPGGLFAFNVFLSDCLYARRARSRWWILTPAMSQVWNAPLLTRVLAEHGLEVVARRREAPYTDLDKVLGYLGRPSLLAAARRLGLAERVIRLPLPDCYEWLAVRR